MKVCTEVLVSRIGDILCSALEGGSNYWYRIASYERPLGSPKEWKYRSSDDQIFKHLDYPLNAGGALVIEALGDDGTPDEIKGDTKFRLNLQAANKGLQLMAEKYPHHWCDFLQENDDAMTGDVFLQLALFGEVIYG